MTLPLPVPKAAYAGRFEQHIRAGLLRLSVTRSVLPLHDLCGFASRQNARRGFLFVSKVLGKHYPARPAVMRMTYDHLAAPLSRLPGPVVVIGLAETAVGLGHGVYDSLLTATGRTDLLYLHTTRYRLDRPLALQFLEEHSHAADHLLHEPEGEAERALFRTARSLVLVDDEISTGRTFANLASAYARRNPHLEALRLVSLTDWLGKRRRAALKRLLPARTTFVAALEGDLEFVADPDFQPVASPSAVGRGDAKDALLPSHFGRLGVRGPLPIDWAGLEMQAHLEPGMRVLVLSTGEFLFPPFLLAERLAAQGYDVHTQSTTRSPILPGDAITHKACFTDNYGDHIPNFAYNLDPRRYDRILACYETTPTPVEHQLPPEWGAVPLTFPLTRAAGA